MVLAKPIESLLDSIQSGYLIVGQVNQDLRKKVILRYIQGFIAEKFVFQGYFRDLFVQLLLPREAITFV